MKRRCPGYPPGSCLTDTDLPGLCSYCRRTRDAETRFTSGPAGPILIPMRKPSK